MVLISNNSRLPQLLMTTFAETEQMVLHKVFRELQVTPERLLNLLMDGVWIDVGMGPIASLNLLARIRQLFNHASLMYIVSGSTLEPDVVRTAFRLGACDFVDTRVMDLDFESAVRRQKTRVRNRVPVFGARMLLLSSDHERLHKIAGMRGVVPCGNVPISAALQTIAEISPDVLWLEADNVRIAEDTVLELKAKHPTLVVFACLSDPSSGEAFRRLYRAGADDVFDSVLWKRDLRGALKAFFPPKNLVQRLVRTLMP